MVCTVDPMFYVTINLWIVLPKGALHNPVVFSLVKFMIICSSLAMWAFLCVKTEFHPASYILTMEINERCVSPARIYPPIYFGGSCGNANEYYFVDSIVSPFRRPTVIGGL